MPRQLTITPAPFKSSYLAIPPTPFSPLLPISPPASPPKHAIKVDRQAKMKATADMLPPPSEPLHWLWQCHRCNRVYQLGVTRRCLDDGHFFCAGTTVVKRSKKAGYKKVLRHQACASEFDYQGWKAMGTWRRQLAQQVEAAEALLRVEEGLGLELPVVPEEGRWFGGAWTRKPVGSGSRQYWEKEAKPKKDCWNKCDYPSECRWGKQFGVSTPTTMKPATTTVPSSPSPVAKQEQPLTPTTSPQETAKPKTSFDDILISIADPHSPDYLEPLSTTKTHTAVELIEGETVKPSMDDLLQSAKRRKRRSSGQIPLVPSPLGGNPVPSPLGANPPPKPDMERSSSAEDVVRGGKPERVLRKSSSSSALMQKTLDELEADVRRGSGFEGLGELRERADAFVRSFKEARAKFSSGSL